jgi:hypothetical protein
VLSNAQIGEDIMKFQVKLLAVALIFTAASIKPAAAAKDQDALIENAIRQKKVSSIIQLVQQGTKFSPQQLMLALDIVDGLESELDKFKRQHREALDKGNNIALEAQEALLINDIQALDTIIKLMQKNPGKSRESEKAEAEALESEQKSRAFQQKYKEEDPKSYEEFKREYPHDAYF